MNSNVRLTNSLDLVCNSLSIIEGNQVVNINTKLSTLSGSLTEEQLQTISDISEAIDNDPDFFTTMQNKIDLKRNISDSYTITETDSLLQEKLSVSRYDFPLNANGVAFTDTQDNQIVKITNNKDTIFNYNVSCFSNLYVSGNNILPLIDTKRNIADSYTKTEINSALLLKRDYEDSYSATQVNGLLETKRDVISSYSNTEVDTALNLKQNVMSALTGDGVSLFFSTTQLSKLIAGSNITIARILNPGQSDDGQIQITANVDGVASLTNYYTKTQSDNNYYNKSLVYTKTETDTAIANLVDSAPATLNTLNELAQALNDDPNFATTITNQIAGKEPAFYAISPLQKQINLGTTPTTFELTLDEDALAIKSDVDGLTTSVSNIQTKIGNSQVGLVKTYPISTGGNWLKLGNLNIGAGQHFYMKILYSSTTNFINKHFELYFVKSDALVGITAEDSNTFYASYECYGTGNDDVIAIKQVDVNNYIFYANLPYTDDYGTELIVYERPSTYFTFEPSTPTETPTGTFVYVKAKNIFDMVVYNKTGYRYIYGGDNLVFRTGTSSGYQTALQLFGTSSGSEGSLRAYYDLVVNKTFNCLGSVNFCSPDGFESNCLHNFTTTASTINTQLTINGNLKVSGNTTLNCGRGDIYLEDNANDNQNGAGITLRTNVNPSTGGIFSVRSLGHAPRFWVGQALQGMCDTVGMCYTSGVYSDCSNQANYKHVFKSTEATIGTKLTINAGTYATLAFEDNGTGIRAITTSTSRSLTMGAGTTFASGNEGAYIQTVGGTSGKVVCQMNTNGVLLARNASAWTSNSDERLKDVSGDIENALDSINQIKAVKYKWKKSPDKDYIGVLAQSVQKVLPEVIDEMEHEDGKTYLGVRYTELIPLLISGIQELTLKLKQLEKKP